MADDNQALIEALKAPQEMREYKPKQATETWLEFLKRQGPEVANGVAMALAGIRPGTMMRGPAQGILRPEDFAIAEQLRNQGMNGAAGRPWETADTMGQFTGVRDASTGGQLRNFSREAAPDPYLTAVTQQRMFGKPANENR